MPSIIKPTFPPELLSASHGERITYFAKKGIAHEAIVNAFALAKDNINFGTPGEIIPIVGPTGVGTTKLGGNLRRHYQKEGEDTMGDVASSTLRFALHVDAPSQAGSIDKTYWERLFKAMLHQGGDILIDGKICVPPSEFVLTHSIPWVDSKRGDIDTLMRATASMLKMRKTKVLFINQAHRLFPEGDVGGCTRSQQNLVDFAGQTQARIVLIGDYGLIRASCSRNNWLRRQLIVHLRRYDGRNASEREVFVSAVEGLLASMPLPEWQRLERLTLAGASEIYVRSVGCIGSCKNAFSMVLQYVLRTGEKVTEEILLRFMPPVVVAKEIALDAFQGEQMLLDEDSAGLAKLLEFGTSPENSGDSSQVVTAAPKAVSGSNGYANRRIGERKPTRDPAGEVHAKRA